MLKQKSLVAVSVIGARPHFMKLKPIHDALMEAGHHHIIIHTGQHYDFNLSGQFIDEMELPQPDMNLHVGSQAHLDQMAEIMKGLNVALPKFNPDVVFVYGDTNSTAAAAIAAAKLNFPLAHIESGLREFDRTVPEETNKLIIDSISDYLFAPTEVAYQQLLAEGQQARAYWTGDVVLDFVLAHPDKIVWNGNPMDQTPYYLFTCHRAHNTDDETRFRAIVDGITSLNKKVIWPIHPRASAAVEKYNLQDQIAQSQVELIEPQSFWNTQYLIRQALGTITDSGGLSKESYFHATPCILIDNQIEWQELVDAGAIQIAGADTAKIIELSQAAFPDSKNERIFGDGTAAKQIIDIIATSL